MNRPLFILSAIFLALCCGAGKNIILLVVDDYGSTACVPYGCDDDYTPNIDALSTDGMTFSRMFAHPTCASSRAALYTGRDAHRSGISNPLGANLPTNEYCIARSFQSAGYSTWISGKWNLWTDDTAQNEVETEAEHLSFNGFDTNLVFEGTTIDYGDASSHETFTPYQYLQFTLAQIEANQSNSFFGIHAFGLPHSPFDIGTPFDQGATNNRTENFWAKMEYADYAVSNIVAKIEELNLSSNTVICLVGDNGTDPSVDVNFNGSPVAGGKATYGFGQWVPGYFVCPGYIESGSSYSGVTAFVDVGLTLVDIAGLSMPSGALYDGRSFRKNLLGGNRNHRSTAGFGSGSIVYNSTDGTYMQKSTGLYQFDYNTATETQDTSGSQVSVVKSIMLTNVIVQMSTTTSSNMPPLGYVNDRVLITDP